MKRLLPLSLWRRLPVSVLALAACANPDASSLHAAPAAELTVVVVSHHWSAHAVDVVCQGRRLASIRNLAFNRIVSRGIRMAGCDTVRFRVEILAAGTFRYPYETLIQPGDTVFMDIAPELSLSTVWKGAEARRTAFH